VAAEAGAPAGAADAAPAAADDAAPAADAAPAVASKNVAKDLITKMLTFDPRKRISSDDAL